MESTIISLRCSKVVTGPTCIHDRINPKTMQEADAATARSLVREILFNGMPEVWCFPFT